ncbi:MAG: DUF4384 domain-containing protein [Bacteroidales bacterium]|nr:DUF4384 domain-containing protein [Bacteroidales bacterium]MBQ9312073.1 DUF4384 domain-containing protein [Bacteroidales bacterium]
MKNIFVIFILYIGIFSVCSAQKIVDVCGEYTYYYPSTVSPEQAKQTAINRARIEGLIKEFNQTVYQTNTTVITSNKNGESSSDFISIGGSNVQGEWIEDTKEPQVSFYTKDNMFICIAKVCGKAKKITNTTEFTSKVLCNGTDGRYESNKFRAGDYLYLSFLSASDGWLCVYLLDREAQEVFCLLPYRNSPNGTIKIKHDTLYLFFDPQDSNQPDYDYIEGNLYITCTKEIEYNEVYVIFSPNNFSKANGSKIKGEYLPRQLSFKDFQKWLISCQTKDRDIKVNKHLIEINKK